MIVRGKFQVLSRKVQHWNKDQVVVQLGAVYKDPASEENTMFHKATPSGEINLTIDNPVASEFFELGKTVYADFSDAPAK